MSEAQKKAAETMRKRYGKDYHSKIAVKATAKWEENGRKPRGFAAMKLKDPERLKELSVKANKASLEKRKK